MEWILFHPQFKKNAQILNKKTTPRVGSSPSSKKKKGLDNRNVTLRSVTIPTLTGDGFEFSHLTDDPLLPSVSNGDPQKEISERPMEGW